MAADEERGFLDSTCVGVQLVLVTLHKKEICAVGRKIFNIVVL